MQREINKTLTIGRWSWRFHLTSSLALSLSFFSLSPVYITKKRELQNYFTLSRWEIHMIDTSVQNSNKNDALGFSLSRESISICFFLVSFYHLYWILIKLSFLNHVLILPSQWCISKWNQGRTNCPVITVKCSLVGNIRKQKKNENKRGYF